MNDVKQVYGTPRLVCLEVSDEMPTDLIAPDLSNLFFSFLHTVLAKAAQAETHCLGDTFRGLSLRDSDERDVLPQAAASRAGVSDQVVDPSDCISQTSRPRSSLPRRRCGRLPKRPRA